MKIGRGILTIVFVLSVLLAGCSKTVNVPEVQRPGIEISSMVTGIGAVNANDTEHNTQRFSYSISLTNHEKNEVIIKEITLVLTPEFEKILITKQLTVQVNKTITPKSSIEIKGYLDFNAKGMSKDDIVKLNPRITSVKVLSEETISLDKWANSNQ
jgi:predicted NUDIX family phosphoesterase